MARFVRGDLVVVPFPFSGMSGTKNRPAIILASWGCMKTTDYLLCMVSSRNTDDPYAVPLAPGDIEHGSLTVQSYVRPTYLFALGEHRIERKIGTLKPNPLAVILQKLRGVLD